MQVLFGFLIRALLLAAGLVFALSLLIALGLVLVFWAVRALWAKLTGQPVAPLVMRIDPRAGFRRYARRSGVDGDGGADRDGAVPARSPRAALGDVTDVQPKEPRS